MKTSFGLAALALADYLDSDFSYYTHYELAEAYGKLQERDRAIESCEKSLQLNPDFGAAARLLEELKRD